jgi:hypothetical protein
MFAVARHELCSRLLAAVSSARAVVRMHDSSSIWQHTRGRKTIRFKVTNKAHGMLQLESCMYKNKIKNVSSKQVPLCVKLYITQYLPRISATAIVLIRSYAMNTNAVIAQIPTTTTAAAATAAAILVAMHAVSVYGIPKWCPVLSQ